MLYITTTGLLRSIAEADPREHTVLMLDTERSGDVCSTDPIVVPPHVSLLLYQAAIKACLRFDSPTKDSEFIGCLVTSETDGDLLDITPGAIGKLFFFFCCLRVRNGGLAPARCVDIHVDGSMIECKRPVEFASVFDLGLGPVEEADAEN